MRKLTAGLALTAGLLGGAAGTAAVGSGAASAVTATSAAAVSDRVSEIKDALSGLVTDGTLTQKQADEVAETLDDADLGRGFGHGPGHGHGHGPGGFGDPSELADILGVTTEELRTALEDGKTLAQVAEAEGIARTALIDKLVAAADDDLEEAVADGRLTEAQAAEIRERLTARITERVDRAPNDGRGLRGRHPGPSGGGPDHRLIGPSATLSSSA